MSAAVSVLVVDDNAEFCRALAATFPLVAPDFHPSFARTAGEALALLDSRQSMLKVPSPRFIVLDFNLPDRKAPALLIDLRARGILHVPVLVLSQADWDQDRVAALAAGATAFQMKASDVDDLCGAIVAFWRDYVDGRERVVDRR